MTDHKPYTFADTLDAEALNIALTTFKKHHGKGASELESMSRAIIAYCIGLTVAREVSLRFPALMDCDPLEVAYPDFDERRIAIQERKRARSLISAGFEEMDWEGEVEVSEVKYFLAMLQDEIDGL